MNNKIITAYEQSIHKPEYIHWYEIEREIVKQLDSPFNLDQTLALLVIMNINASYVGAVTQLKKFISTGIFQGFKMKQIKINSILKGDDITSTLKGKKSVNFFNNLKAPKDKKYCTIDRHMAEISGWSDNRNYKVPTSKQYELVKNEFIECANFVNMIPSQFQSLLWCNKINSK